MEGIKLGRDVGSDDTEGLKLGCCVGIVLIDGISDGIDDGV